MIVLTEQEFRYLTDLIPPENCTGDAPAFVNSLFDRLITEPFKVTVGNEHDADDVIKAFKRLGIPAKFAKESERWWPPQIEIG